MKIIKFPFIKKPRPRPKGDPPKDESSFKYLWYHLGPIERFSFILSIAGLVSLGVFMIYLLFWHTGFFFGVFGIVCLWIAALAAESIYREEPE